MNRFKLTLVMLFTLVQCPTLFAHPGHGARETVNPNGILHYLTEPVHVMPFIIIAVIMSMLIGGKKFLQRFRDQRQKVLVRVQNRRK